MLDVQKKFTEMVIIGPILAIYGLRKLQLQLCSLGKKLMISKNSINNMMLKLLNNILKK